MGLDGAGSLAGRSSVEVYGNACVIVPKASEPGSQRPATWHVDNEVQNGLWRAFDLWRILRDVPIDAADLRRQ